jgi:hypothetical protein
MIVSKNSWHYKLNTSKATMQWIKDSVRYNRISLCQYFWLTVASLLIATIGVIGIIAIICLVISALFALVVLPFAVLLNASWLYFTGDLLYNAFTAKEDIDFGAIMLFVWGFIAILVCSLMCKHDEMDFAPEWVVNLWQKITKHKTKEHTFEEKVKEPSLLASFIKAKKEKVCPLIEFKD